MLGVYLYDKRVIDIVCSDNKEVHALEVNIKKV